MRKILIVGNWKMHLNTSQASLLAHRLHERIKIHRDIEVVLAPSMLTLQPLSLQGSTGLNVAVGLEGLELRPGR